MSRGRPARRATANVRRLSAAIFTVVGLFVPVLSAVATECRAEAECVGTSGSDELYGTPGKDRIFGRGGDDLLAGRPSPDRLFGGPGDDRLKGQNGTDHLFGGDGDDVLIGGDQPDDDGEITDRLHGGHGADELHADSEDDAMFGGAGADVLHGTRWEETLTGGAGDDRIYGAGGRDYYSLVGGKDWGHDVIVDGSNRNALLLPELRKNPLDIRVNLEPSAERPEVWLVGGGASVNWRGHAFRVVQDGAGNDTIRGDAERNRIFILRGRDSVFAGGGNDHVQANDDNGDVDRIDCGPGRDSVNHHAEDRVADNCERTYVIP